MVVSRLSQPDVQERGWLLDGYPRSFGQAQSLENLKIRPDIFIVLEVSQKLTIYDEYYINLHVLLIFSFDGGMPVCLIALPRC
jgi:adenylate kinase family enzyme